MENIEINDIILIFDRHFHVLDINATDPTHFWVIGENNIRMNILYGPFKVVVKDIVFRSNEERIAYLKSLNRLSG